MYSYCFLSCAGPCHGDATACFPVCSSFCFLHNTTEILYNRYQHHPGEHWSPSQSRRVFSLFAWLKHYGKDLPFIILSKVFPSHPAHFRRLVPHSRCRLCVVNKKTTSSPFLPAEMSVLGISDILFSLAATWLQLHFWSCRFQGDSWRLTFWAVSVVSGAESSSYLTWPIKVFIWVH